MPEPDDALEPALTREQWERYFRGERLDELVGVGTRIVDGGLETPINLRGHPLAALALYGQPYGFTHSDIVLLGAGKTMAEMNYDGMRKRQFQELADKIRVLLPPEDLEKEHPANR